MSRTELSTLAVTRAATYLDRLRPGWRESGLPPAELTRLLELWYLRTRFAYRVPLEEVVAALLAAADTEPPEGPGRQG
ncbi:MAG: hypothetical protein WC972_08510 [Trueperaceae bacterium]|jgi:hypothetical protein|nr:hypothetical protein [Truepera sp.]HRN19053.1 hypothetical protein [Trueperaceae bacterium]HRQ10442.1 hypothetical protein [Trueperaceae bacterium]